LVLYQLKIKTLEDEWLFPLTENEEKAKAFFDFVVKELSVFENTEDEIPKERQLEFHIARILQKKIQEQKDILNWKIFMSMGSGFQAMDLVNQSKMSAKGRIDITLFYYPKNIDQSEEELFSEVIEIKRSGNIPGDNNKTDEQYKVDLESYFAEEYYKTKETNTIAHDFRRLVNFVGGPTKIVRAKYKGNFKKKHNVFGGLFIDLYSEEQKKRVIEFGAKYWEKKKKELKNSLNYYIYAKTSKLKNQKKQKYCNEYLSIVYFTKKELSESLMLEE